MKMKIYSPISNYYGVPYVKTSGDEKFWFVLDDYNGPDEVEVSKAFYDAFVAEFGESKE